VPDILETLHDTVQAGLGSPPDLDIVRERVAARRRRRLMPVSAIAVASVVAVGTIGLVLVAERHVSVHNGRPGGTTTVPPRPGSKGVTVDTSLTPPGWVAVDWGDLQLSVPASWKLNDPCQSPTINFGTPSAVNCADLGKTYAYVDVEPISAVPRNWPHISLNGLSALEPAAVSQPASAPSRIFIVIPALRVQVSADASGSSPTYDSELYRIMKTLTYSPRYVLFRDGVPPSPPRSWSTITFEGLSLRVPPADAALETDVGEFPYPMCAFPFPVAMPYGVTEDMDDQDVGGSSCNFIQGTVSSFEHAEPGVFTDVRVSAGTGLAGAEEPCFSVHKLHVCPFSAAYDVLYLKVSGGSMPHALLVRIGLSGNGLAARQILYSMHSS
jgi:hypothetical protein